MSPVERRTSHARDRISIATKEMIAHVSHRRLCSIAGGDTLPFAILSSLDNEKSVVVAPFILPYKECRMRVKIFMGKNLLELHNNQ